MDHGGLAELVFAQHGGARWWVRVGGMPHGGTRWIMVVWLDWCFQQTVAHGGLVELVFASTG